MARRGGRVTAGVVFIPRVDAESGTGAASVRRCCRGGGWPGGRYLGAVCVGSGGVIAPLFGTQRGSVLRLLLALHRLVIRICFCRILDFGSDDPVREKTAEEGC